MEAGVDDDELEVVDELDEPDSFLESEFPESPDAVVVLLPLSAPLFVALESLWPFDVSLETSVPLPEELWFGSFNLSE